MNLETFPYKWWAIIGLGLLSFTAYLDFTIVTTALPYIQKDLNVPIIKLQWVMTIYAMIICMFMIISGKAGDIFGRTRVFYIGFILFGIAAIGAATADSINVLIFFRAIQAFAGAIIATVGVSLLPQTFPAKQQTLAIGIYSALNGAGLALGPFIGGLLLTFFNWRSVFWINVPIIIIGMICISFSLKPSPKPNFNIKIDWYGLLLLIIGMGCFIYGITHGEQVGWNSSVTWSMIISSIIAFILLLLVESRVVDPLLELSLFKNIKACIAMLVCVTAGLIIFVFMFFDPLYLNLIREQSPLFIGLTLFCVPIVQVFISLLLEKLIHQFGTINLLIFGLAFALIAAILHAFFSMTTSIFFVLFALILMGYTWGIANAGSISALAQSLPPEKMGAAIGTLFTFLNISGAVFLALSTVIFHWLEKITFNSILMKLHLQLSAEQSQAIKIVLAEPSQAHILLNQFAGGKNTEILQAFHLSFIIGFHGVAWFSAIIMLIIFMMGVKLYFSEIHQSVSQKFLHSSKDDNDLTS